ncbi:MAG: glutathione peroxidase [Deltaproteobacteria bacterium]|nr:glutathione peroxidase [Deltaproteobacteria bacterium]
MGKTFYDFEAISLSGERVSMATYRGSVILVVNTASKCGFTPQYAGLETLYRRYQEKGLVILGFPCNQFFNQEPDDETAIASQCLVNYGVSFPMFSKIKVNGSGAHPIFKYLKRVLKGSLGDAIKWNFTKFLLDRDGHPVKRFAPTATPESIEPHIVALLREGNSSAANLS